MSEKSGSGIAGSLADIVSNASELLRLNISMLRVEMSEKVSQAFLAGVALLVSAIILAFALSYAIFGMYLWLTMQGFSPFAAAWMIAGVMFAIGGLLMLIGMVKLLKFSAVPDRTIAELNKNMSAIKGTIRRQEVANDVR